MGIALENVSFTYQEGTPLASTALSDVSLTIEDGSYTALIGHTGSGKSTFKWFIGSKSRECAGF